VPGRFRQCFGLGLCLSQIMAEGGRGAAIRCDVSARHRQCFSFCLCLCPGLCLSQIMTSPVRPQLGGLVIPCFRLCLCPGLSQIMTSPVRPQLGGLVIPCFRLCLCPGLSQIMTSPVRPQLGGLVIPCFCLCLCCFVQPACLRTRMAVPSGTAIPALSSMCCSCSTEKSCLISKLHRGA
jgi:hypothetical protein